MSNYCSTVLKYLLYYCSTTAHTETPKQSVTGVSKQNKSHMMLISRLIKTLPAAGAAVQWKHRSIRRIKRPKESMLALLAQTQKWINVDGEMRSKWERERETEKEREREGGRGGETDWIPPATALFNSQRVDVTCWPHSGHTGHQNKCQQQTDRGKVWKEKRAREGRGWEKLETDKTTKRDQWVGTNSVIAAKRKRKKKKEGDTTRWRERRAWEKITAWEKWQWSQGEWIKEREIEDAKKKAKITEQKWTCVSLSGGVLTCQTFQKSQLLLRWQEVLITLWENTGSESRGCIIWDTTIFPSVCGLIQSNIWYVSSSSYIFYLYII